MKKAILITVALCMALSLNAGTFDGFTSTGLNYEYRDGIHLGGMTVSNSGYVNDFPVGYYISANADFNPRKISDMTITLIAAPSYRYMLDNVPMSIDTALGLSVSGVWTGGKNDFQLGLGGYIGAAYYMNDRIALLIGCNLGYDMLSVNLATGAAGFSGEFYASPALSIGFRY
mgnify:CR=1 FL=1